MVAGSPLSNRLSAECSSPVGAALLQRKVARQSQPQLLRPTPRIAALQIDDDEDTGSPRFRDRLEELRLGNDPSQRSSPLGTALLMRKVSHQTSRRTPGNSENIPGMDLLLMTPAHFKPLGS